MDHTDHTPVRVDYAPTRLTSMSEAPTVRNEVNNSHPFAANDGLKHSAAADVVAWTGLGLVAWMERVIE